MSERFRTRAPSTLIIRSRLSDTYRTMTNHHYTTILLVATVAGCNLDLSWGDPCEQDLNGNFTHPLSSSLSADEKLSCNECGLTDCSGGTGEEEDQTWWVSQSDWPPNGDTFFAVSGNPLAGPYPRAWGVWQAAAGAALEAVQGHTISPGECPAGSAAIPTYNLTLFEDPTESHHYCDVQHAPSGLATGDSLAGIRLCAGDGEWALSFPTDYGGHLEQNGEKVGWGARLHCGDGQYSGLQCDIGPALLWADDGGQKIATASCLCETDADCAGSLPGAVCEGGFKIVDGFPEPTYCVWDGQGGHGGNGFVPDGEPHYGIDDFGRHLTELDVGVFEVSREFALNLARKPASVLNDDQRADIAAENLVTLTHCGPRALCAALGLEAGDMIEFPEAPLSDLVSGHLEMQLTRAGVTRPMVFLLQM